MGTQLGATCLKMSIWQGARTCWFTEAESDEEERLRESGSSDSQQHAPLPTLLALEQTIADRRASSAPASGMKRLPVCSPSSADRQICEYCLTGSSKPSWTVRLLGDPDLLCSKIREEAGELCQTLEQGEGSERAASEMADLLYHSMVLLNLQASWTSKIIEKKLRHSPRQQRNAHGQEVPIENVLWELRRRFGTSGVEEKALRKRRRGDQIQQQ